MLQPIRQYLYRTRINKRSKKHPDRRNTVNLASSIGIICNADKPDNIKAVSAFKEKLEKRGKKAKVLGYSSKKEDLNHLPFPYFNKKNISWYDSVQAETVDTFINSNFDLLINLDMSDIKAIHYVVAICSAKLKIGKQTASKESYQIMVNEDSPDMRIEDLISQIDNILKLLNSAS